MRHFRRFLVLAMRARWVTLLVTLCLFGAALYGMRLVPQQFFPSSDRPELLVDLQLPENASIYATRDISARVDQLLKGDQDVDHWSTYVGQGAVRFYLPLNVQLPNDFFGQLVVVTKGLAAARARQGEAGAGAGHRLSERCRTGLSAGARAACRLAAAIPGERGRSPDQVRAIAFKVAQILDDDPGARNVNYNWMEPARTVQHPGRPGPGAAPRAELGEPCPGPEHGRVRHHCNPDAQRHLSRRCARPRVRRAAHVARRRSARFRCRCRTGRRFR